MSNDPLEAAAAELAGAVAALRRAGELLAEARIAHRDAAAPGQPCVPGDRRDAEFWIR
jgi:hypothetical protein